MDRGGGPWGPNRAPRGAGGLALARPPWRAQWFRGAAQRQGGPTITAYVPSRQNSTALQLPAAWPVNGAAMLVKRGCGRNRVRYPAVASQKYAPHTLSSQFRRQIMSTIVKDDWQEHGWQWQLPDIVTYTAVCENSRGLQYVHQEEMRQ